MGLRDWYQFAGQSEPQPQVFAELRPGLLVTTPWTASGAAWWATLPQPTFGGAALDVAAVDTDNRRLTRVDSSDACAALEHSYYYDSAGARLWIRTTSTDVPTPTNGASIVARPAVIVGTEAVTLPILGPELVANGGFESDLTSWVTSGTVSTGATFLPDGDALCAVLSSAGAFVRQNVATLDGALYCAAGSYVAGPNGGLLELLDDNGTLILDSTGRHYSGGPGQVLPSTWVTPLAPDALSERSGRRRFVAFFTASGGRVRVRVTAQAGPAAPLLKLDGLSVRRVYAWSRSLPWLSAGGVPSIDEGRSGTWFGPWRIGDASLSLLNDGGVLATLTGAFEFAGADCIVRVGGRFPNGGEEITPDALKVIHAGRVRDLELTPSSLTLTSEDGRGAARRLLPTRTFTRSTYASQDARLDAVHRPLALGYCQDVPPARVGTTPEGLPAFELCDPDGWTPGIAIQDGARRAKCWLYLDDVRASKGDTGYRTDVTDHLQFDATGTMTALKCVKPVAIEGQFFSFDIGGSQLDVLLTPSQEETLTHVATGLGANNNFAPGGAAASVVDGVGTLDDGKYARSASTSGIRRLELTFPSLTGSSAIQWLEVRAWHISEGNAGETLKLYVDPSGTGTRYYSDWTKTDPASVAYTEYSWRLTKNPATGNDWTEAEVNACRIGAAEFNPAGATYLRADLVQRLVRRVTTSAPNASLPGVRSPSQVAALLAAAMNAAAGVSDISVGFEEDSFLFRVSRASGTFNLRTKTGKAPNGWQMIGYETDADMSGSGVDHYSTQPYYASPADIDAHTLRVDFLGIADDAAGTYTGTPGVAIERGADVLRWLLVERLRVTPDLIHAASFNALRATRTAVVALYLTSPTEFGQLVQMIETGDLASLVLDGERYRYDATQTALLPTDPLVYEDEIGSIGTRQSAGDVARRIVVRYSPGSQVGRGTMPAVEAAVPGVRALYGEADALELVIAQDLTAASTVLGAFAARLFDRAPRLITVSGRGDMAARRVGSALGLRGVAGVIATTAGVVDVDAIVVRRQVDGETLRVTLTAVEMP